MSMEVEISTDRSRVDVGLVHEFLSASYWAQGRSRSVVERCIENSLCFGAYQNARQVAFGRIVTDYAVFAYVADVFVVSEARGQGIGKQLAEAMLSHPDISGLAVTLLRTRDAHSLYTRHGFKPLPRPEEMLGRYGVVAI